MTLPVATSNPVKGGQGGQGTDKSPVLSLVNAKTGEVRSAVVTDVTGATLRKTIGEQVDVVRDDAAHRPSR